MSPAFRTLLVDDNPDDRALILRELRQEFGEVQPVEVIDGAGLERALAGDPCDLAITDAQLHWSDGLSVLRALRQRWADCPVIMFTGTGNEQIAVEAMKAGVDDYVLKSPQHYVSLRASARAVVDRARQRKALQETQRRLREDEARLRSILDNTPECVKVLDARGRLLEMNRAGLEMLEVDDIRVLLNQPLEEFVLPEYREAFGAVIKAVCRGEISELEFEMVGRKGTHRFLHTHAVPFPDTSNGGYLVLSVTRDITETRKAEQEIRDSHERFYKLFRGSPSPIGVGTTEGRFIEVNDRYVEFFGYSREELAAKTVRQLRLWANPDERDLVIAKLKKGESVRNYEAAFRRKDGEIRHALISMEFLDKSEHSPIVAMLVDITDRKRAEETLRASEERYRIVAQTATDAIITIDESSRILFVNPAAEKIFGYSLPEMLGQEVTMLMPELLRALHRSAVQRYLDTGKRHIDWDGVELPGLHKEGHEFPLEISFGEHIQDGRHIFTGIVRDITDRKRAQAELAASEQRFRSLIENSSDAIALFDAEGKVLYGSPATTRVLGYDPAELIGRTAFEFVHPEDLDGFRQFMKECLATPGVPLLNRARVLQKDGNWRLLEGVFTNLLDDPAVRAITNNYRDITEREALRKSSAALAQSLDPDVVLRTLLECLGELVPFDTANVMLREGTRMTIRACMRAEGWKHVPSDVGHVFDGATNPVVANFLEAKKTIIIPDTRTVAGWERPEKGRHVVSWMGVPLMSGGEIIGVYSVDKAEPNFFTDEHRQLAEALAAPAAVAVQNALLHQAAVQHALDLEEQIRVREWAEAALRESEAKFRVLSESAGSAILISQGDRIVYANREAENISGYPRRELMAKNFMEFIHPEFRALVGDRRAARLRGEEIIPRYEIKIIAKGGQERWLDFSTGIVDWEGQPAILGTATDITERRRLEEQFRQAQKMEAVGRLAGGIAHDFNNLLSVIIGYSELVLEKLPAGDAVRGKVQEILRSGDRAAALTRQLLAFSRQQVLQPRVLNLNSIVDDMRKLLGRLLKENIRLEVRLNPALGLIQADPSQVEQVVMNLAVNASDAMPHGGHLTIETENLELEEAVMGRFAPVQPGRYVVLSVSDTGVGMDPATQDRIFEPFFTTKELGKGTGLGLATVYGIVKQSEGYITVYSEPGKGSTFKIYLPRVDKPEEKPIAAPSAESYRGTETILVVEDEESLRSLMVIFLEQSGYRVHVAENAAMAMDLVGGTKQKIDMLLTDVILPGMSGRELAGKLQPLYPGLKVLYASGYTDDAISHHGILEPGIDFLQKPFTRLALLEKVRSILDRKT